MQEIDIHLFIDIIITEGVKPLYTTMEDDLQIDYVQGINGKKVEILVVPGESITQTTATDLLNKLGLSDLVQRMFPD